MRPKIDCANPMGTNPAGAPASAPWFSLPRPPGISLFLKMPRK